MNKLTWLVPLVVLNFVLLGVVAFGGDDKVREVVRENVGAVSTPDFQTNYFSYGGVRHLAAKDTSLIDASTTVCALLGPTGTSTLQFGSIKFTTGATTTQTVSIGTGDTPYAIDTLIATSSAAANEKITVVAASTTQVAANFPTAITDKIMRPSHYLVFTISSANAYTDVEGICEATWIEN